MNTAPTPWGLGGGGTGGGGMIRTLTSEFRDDRGERPMKVVRKLS